MRKATGQLVLSRQARKLAEEKRQVRFEVHRVLAHELKAPLAAVEGYLNILATTEADQNLAMVERSIVRVDGMRKLIVDLLDLTRIESGQRERSIRGWTCLGWPAARVELSPPTPRRRATCTVTLDAPGDVELLADAGEIEIVLNNLVSNAVKYNRDGGRVDVKLSRVADGVAIAVADTGIGLKPEEAAKLFASSSASRTSTPQDPRQRPRAVDGARIGQRPCTTATRSRASPAWAARSP